MKRTVSALCFLLAFGGLVQAGDAKPDPTGTWKQTSPATRETSFTFKLNGEALTGRIQRPKGSIAITNGTVIGDQLSFQTRHEASEPKGTIVTTTFSGTLSGDTITGKRVTEAGGKDLAVLPWQIKRESDKSKESASK